MGGIEQGEESEPAAERMLGSALVAEETGYARTFAAELERDPEGFGLVVVTGRVHGSECALASRRRQRGPTLDWTLKGTL